VHASVSGALVAVGLYGTDMVAVIDTRDDSLAIVGTLPFAGRPHGVDRGVAVILAAR
jgi:hypothetical protein